MIFLVPLLGFLVKKRLVIGTPLPNWGQKPARRGHLQKTLIGMQDFLSSALY